MSRKAEVLKFHGAQDYIHTSGCCALEVPKAYGAQNQLSTLIRKGQYLPALCLGMKHWATMACGESPLTCTELRVGPQNLYSMNPPSSSFFKRGSHA